jgi:hypothetical protein
MIESASVYFNLLKIINTKMNAAGWKNKVVKQKSLLVLAGMMSLSSEVGYSNLLLNLLIFRQ